MARTHTLVIREIDRKVFEAIRNRTKTIETRAATDKYKTVKEGDILEFVCGDDHLQKKVKAVKLFESIEEIVAGLGIKPIMPFVDSVKEMKLVYYSFPNYKEKIEQFGLVAFILE